MSIAVILAVIVASYSCTYRMKVSAAPFQRGRVLSTASFGHRRLFRIRILGKSAPLKAVLVPGRLAPAEVRGLCAVKSKLIQNDKHAHVGLSAAIARR